MAENKGMRLETRLQQRLILTPMMQQSLQILQLPAMELAEYIQEQITDNPVLETVEEKEIEGREDRERETAQAQDPEEFVPLADSENEVAQEIRLDQTSPGQGVKLEEWSQYFEETSSEPYSESRETSKRKFFENTITVQPTLQDHLLWQLQLFCRTDEEFGIGEELIGNINEDGYLQGVDLEGVAASLEVGLEAVQGVLKLIQGFEPTGVGARDLKESLLIQLEAKGLKDSPAYMIVENHLERFEKKHLAEIKKQLSLSEIQMQEASHLISSLEPKPGLEFGKEVPKYVVPDVLVEEINGELKVFINQAGVPRLRLSRAYRNLLRKQVFADPEEKKYLEQKVQAAIWLIRNLDQRQRTIHRVAEALVSAQRDFFREGVDFLKPLTLKQIAAELGLHESTLSRVSVNKYLQCQPWGF